MVSLLDSDLTAMVENEFLSIYCILKNLLLYLLHLLFVQVPCWNHSSFAYLILEKVSLRVSIDLKVFVSGKFCVCWNYGFHVENVWQPSWLRWLFSLFLRCFFFKACFCLSYILQGFPQGHRTWGAGPTYGRGPIAFRWVHLKSLRSKWVQVFVVRGYWGGLQNFNVF